MSTPCLLPQGYVQFFPGTKGDTGPAGPAGPASTVIGPDGAAGAVGVYTGPFNSLTTYYDNANRRDIVFYAGRFWITSNTARTGTATWETPNTSGDWTDFGASLVLVATSLELLSAQEITVGINIATPGFIKSNNFVDGVSGWLLTAAGVLNAYDAVIAGLVSTNTPRFNLEDPDRTMPPVAYAEFEIPVILDAAIPANPTINNVTDNALIIFGWKEDLATFKEERFGSSTQKFSINLNGTGDNTSAGSEQFYIQIYYRTRTNGGAWGAWTVIGHDAYMQKLAALNQSFELTRDLTIVLTGDNDIQFSAGFSKATGGTVSVAGAKITVKAFN